MKLVSYQRDGKYRMGLVVQGGVLDAASAAVQTGVDVPRSSDDFYAQGNSGLDAYRRLADSDIGGLADHVLNADSLAIAPVVPSPGKILCVGLNYRRHAEESGMPIPTEPILFSKFNNSLCAHGCDVQIGGLEQVDYEAELAVVIGQRAKNVPENAALDHVLGYAIANDLSDRKLQFVSGQWLIGKTLDGFLPLGPYLVTADETGDPQALDVKGWLNGELRQDSNTSDMIFSVAEIIAYASRFMTLCPGDVILTGTPEGVVLGMKEKKWMQPGDQYEIEVEKLGRLRNRVVDEL